MSNVTNQPIQSPSANRGRMHPEIVRCLCCIGVVAGHCDLNLIGVAVAGVGGFLTISVYFALEGANGASMRSRALRTTKLWIAWSAIYALVLVLRDVGKGRWIGEGFEWWMLATGPAIHLWYLPALAVSLLSLSILVTATQGTPSLRRGLTLTAGVIASVALVSHVWQPWPLPKPFGQAVLAALIVCLAVAVHPMTLSLGYRAVGVGWLTIATGFAMQLLKFDSWIGLALVVFGTSAVCSATRSPHGRSLTWFASLTGGIYLCHMLFVAGLRFVGFDTGHWIPLVLVASAVLTALARRTRLIALFP
ncbi:MAG: acyltransferase [Limnohabitans sp.]|jgi:hypothetical protein|nr:acyltransferase [Limnohabitans sp.]